jgi:hypothetical protein
MYLEKKIEETQGIHISHNKIYQIFLSHGPMEVNMKKRKQWRWVRYERDHPMSFWQEGHSVIKPYMSLD